MAIMAFRASSSSVYGRLPLVHPPPQLTAANISSRPTKLHDHSHRMKLYARYSQAQDRFTARLQDRVQDLPKLFEDIVQTSITTGPRGAFRLAQGVLAVAGVGSEWLADVSKWTNTSAGVPIELQLGLLSPYYLRKLFERLGATYIKLGQFIASAPSLFPPEYVAEFQKCFDQAPAVPFDEIKAILNQELKRPIDSVYEYVDPTPIASASIAQISREKGRKCEREKGTKVDLSTMATIIVPNHADPHADAEALRKACEGWGTDEEGIIEVIGHRNAGQRKMIKEAYQSKYDEDLIRRFEKELSGDFERAVYRWMLEPFDRDAVLCHVALKERKADFRIIIELSCIPHADEVLQMKRAYHAWYKCSLEEDIASHFTGEMRMLMLLLVSVHRFESDTTDVKLAEKEAEILHDCIKKKEFKHEEIIRIITTRNKTQLIATFYRFKNAYNTPVTKSLAVDKDDKFVAALHTAIKCIKSPQKYLESVVSNAINKRGTDEDDLTRLVVTRAEKDLAQIKDLFHKKNGVKLEDAVGKEISGDYKKFILTLLGAKHD